jgi:hypothetical protein
MRKQRSCERRTAASGLGVIVRINPSHVSQSWSRWVRDRAACVGCVCELCCACVRASCGEAVRGRCDLLAAAASCAWPELRIERRSRGSVEFVLGTPARL